MFYRRLNLLWSMCWFEAQRFRSFPLEIAGNIGGRLAEATLFIVFWLLVGQFSSSGTINPRQVISYYLIITGLVPFFYLGMGLGSQIIKLIKYGELNQVLIKPVNPLFYPFAIRTGRNAIGLGFGLAQTIVGIVVAGGLSMASAPYFVPVLFNTVLLNAAFNITIGTFGFYITEASGIKNGFVHIARLCRGELIPLFLMPAGVATFLQFTPFPASQYHLALLLQGGHTPDWGFVWLGTFWALMLLFLAMRFWQHGLKRYEAVGI